MAIDAELCRRAASSRDPRFDGRFFVGVRTTGIYCRPICPAPGPKPENTSFYPTAAAAERAGLRPCRRCRPETAPGTPEWVGGSASVARALRLIDEGALDGRAVAELAAEVHLGERQLRRLFERHLGAPPAAVARVRRLRLARLLIDQTTLPMTEVASGAGYASLRRFNHEVVQAFGAPPTALRRISTRAGAAAPGALVLRLPYRPPLAWDDLLAYLGARATPGVEEVADGVYRRTVRLGGDAAIVELSHEPDARLVALRVRPVDVDGLADTVACARRLLDLDADPLAIESALAEDAELAPLVAARPGLRVPGAWDGFELAVRTILGQQVSVRGATTLAGRLAAAYGEPLKEPRDGLTRCFPTAAALAEAPCEDVGLFASRAGAIRALATAVRDRRLDLAPSADPEAAASGLVSLPGVGQWTAAYVAMRALRDPDALPAADLGLRQALARHERPATPGEVARRAAAWRPWRSYASAHLWASLADRTTLGRAA